MRSELELREGMVERGLSVREDVDVAVESGYSELEDADEGPVEDTPIRPSGTW